MTTVYLIRHAEAEGNLYRRAHGHYDSTITDKGYRQIAALSRRFAEVPIDAVYSSDLTRTQTTALAIARPQGLTVRREPLLREVGVGVWEDRTWVWLGKFEREQLEAFNSDSARWRVAEAETMEQVRDRMLRALRDIIAAHPNQAVALFSHGMALRLLLGALQGLTLEETDRLGHGENTSVSKLEADETGIRVVFATDASHITDEISTLRRQLWTKNKGGLEPGIWFTPDSAAAGRFLVMQEDERVGAVAVSRCEDGAAQIDELWMGDSVRGRGLGIRLVGQAVSHMRALGCDFLRVALPRDNELGGRRALAYGFSEAGETAEKLIFVKSFRSDEACRIARFDEAMRHA